MQPPRHPNPAGPGRGGPLPDAGSAEGRRRGTRLPFCRLKIVKSGKLVFDETVNGPLGTITEDSKYRYYSQVHSIPLPRNVERC